MSFPKSINFKSSLEAYVDKVRPDKAYDGSVLTVRGEDKSAVFLRFDISPFVRGHTVVGATLKLHSIAQDLYNDDDSIIWDVPSSIKVDVLPLVGDWNDEFVSWNNQLSSAGAFRVASFLLHDLDETDQETILYEVEVSSAFTSLQLDTNHSDEAIFVTFKLSTEAVGKVNFAGKDWNGGTSKPELVLTLSDTAKVSL